MSSFYRDQINWFKGVGIHSLRVLFVWALSFQIWGVQNDEILPRSLQIDPGCSRTIMLDQTGYIEHLWVRVEAVDNVFSEGVLSINGLEVASVFARGDRARVFKVKARAEFRSFKIAVGHQTNSGPLRVTSVKAEYGYSDIDSDDQWRDQSKDHCDGCDDLEFPVNRFTNPVAATANRIKVLVDRLASHRINIDDEKKFLVPIKYAAITLETKADARGEFAGMWEEIKDLTRVLVSKINESKDFLLLTATIDFYADKWCRELLLLSEKLNIPVM